VFEVPAGNTSLTTLASFNGSNGALPGSLLIDSMGNLFGTTYDGGVYGGGTVFEIPKGTATITTIASFNGTNGFNPGDLIEDSSGNFFGMAETFNGDTVFEIPHASGTIVTLASWDDSGTPADLAEDSNGNLFGATQGGTSMVFELKQGSGTITTIATFNNSNGAYPAAVMLDSSGNLFGITGRGGSFGDGTVFEIIHDTTAIKTLEIFSGVNGAWPASLAKDATGNLIGTTGAGGAANDGTVFGVFVNPPGPITLPNATAGDAYDQALGVFANSGPLTYSQAGTLPTGLALSSSGMLSGTPTAAGTFNFSVTLTEPVGISASEQFTLIVRPGPFSEFLPSVTGTVQAGTGFLVTVQAADQFGNAVNDSSTIPISFSTGTSFPTSVTLNSAGLAYFLATVQKAGSCTITAGSGSAARATTVNVTPGPAVKLAFTAKPSDTPTGDGLEPVSVQVEDFYGNVVTSDNGDTVTLGIAPSGPGSFTSTSTLAAAVHNGVATFKNLTLVTPGTYQLSALVPGLYTGPYSAPFTLLPLQVVPGSFAGTPSGFSVQFNAPFLVNATTPALYGIGAGAGATVVPTVTLTQTTGTPPLHTTLPYQVPGSLIVNAASNSLTFVVTDTTSIEGNSTPLLPDGTYVVRISSSGPNGLQALNSGGGYLDGTGAGTPGHDFTATFTVGAAAANDDVLWIPATADGPGQPLSAPGMNQLGGGYPVYLSDQTDKVTSVQATLTYNPALLTVTPTSTATFSVTVPTAGTAVLHYSGPALATGLQTPIGFITATVPAGTMVNPMPYRAKDLLHLSAVSLNGGAIPVATADGLHLVAYVGDADGNGSYSSSDALLITRVTLQTDSGFAAYPVVDPVIVADTDGSGFIPADAALQVNEAGVGVMTANLPVPPILGGVVFQVAAHTAVESIRPLTLHTVVSGSKVRQTSNRALPVITWFIPARHRALGLVEIDTAALDEYFAQTGPTFA
jgi:uncharacterized repeat protein (TIGR03803 family)